MALENYNQTINICFAVDEAYAPYLRVALYSLLCNRSIKYPYNIVILHSDLPRKFQESISSVAEMETDVNVRFLDVGPEAKKLHYKVGNYLSIATIYRLLVFSNLFDEFDKVLYLDCDIIVEGDILELYSMSMENAEIIAVEETGFRQMSYSKKSIFLNGSQPYNVDNYRREALRMKHPERYFNAGVLLIDLAQCRKRFSFEDVTKLLHGKQYHYNDQDVLNILFDGRVKLIDNAWNYQNLIDTFLNRRPEIYGLMYDDLKRESPNIIHYISSFKPWNSDVELGERYHHYEKACKDSMHI